MKNTAITDCRSPPLPPFSKIQLSEPARSRDPKESYKNSSTIIEFGKYDVSHGISINIPTYIV